MLKDNEIFLGKNGKIYGPFSKDDYEKMFAAGKLAEYFWIWDRANEIWKPIELPPASPPLGERNAKSGASVTGYSGIDWQKVKALCFDHVTLACGTVERVTESGCELISRDQEASSKFSTHSAIDLSLYDSPSKKGTKVKVQVAKIDFRDSYWVYRLRWDGIPKF